MSEDLLLARLLCTRLCHDLAGPIGAISAGGELIGTEPDTADEVMLRLLTGSAEAASTKLKVFRLAFGWSFVDGTKLTDTSELMRDYLASIASPSSTPLLVWPGADELLLVGGLASDLGPQLLINLCLLALEGQPVCSQLRLSVTVRRKMLLMTARSTCVDGRSPSFRPDLREALELRSLEMLTPRTAQAYFTARITESLNGSIATEIVDDGVLLLAELPLQRAADSDMTEIPSMPGKS